MPAATSAHSCCTCAPDQPTRPPTGTRHSTTAAAASTAATGRGAHHARAAPALQAAVSARDPRTRLSPTAPTSVAYPGGRELIAAMRLRSLRLDGARRPPAHEVATMVDGLILRDPDADAAVAGSSQRGTTSAAPPQARSRTCCMGKRSHL